jgi:hypothetical protein
MSRALRPRRVWLRWFVFLAKGLAGWALRAELLAWLALGWQMLGG